MVAERPEVGEAKPVRCRRTRACRRVPFRVSTTTSTPRKEQARTAVPSQIWPSLDVWFDLEQRNSLEFSNVDYTAGQIER